MPNVVILSNYISQIKMQKNQSVIVIYGHIASLKIEVIFYVSICIYDAFLEKKNFKFFLSWNNVSEKTLAIKLSKKHHWKRF